MRENEVEKQFVEAVRAAGGQALKFTSQSMNGVPDRLVLLLGGKCAFVELKAPGKSDYIAYKEVARQMEKGKGRRELFITVALSILSYYCGEQKLVGWILKKLA